MINKYNWYDVYTELVNHLHSFYVVHKSNSGEELFRLCKEYKAECVELFPFTEKFFKKGYTKSFDPIHVFASFNNYNIHPETRKRKILFYYKILNIDSSLAETVDYDIFDYFPHVNIVHIVANRKLKYQQEIWDFFNALYFNDQETIKRHFSSSIKSWYGIGIPSLTIFMFWIMSSKYLPLDKNTVRCLKQNGMISSQPSNYNTYLSLNSKTEEYSENLCRNIACYALNKSSKILSKDDKKEIHDFFNYDDTINNLIDIENRLQNEVEKSKKDSPEERRARLRKANRKPSKSTAKTTYYKRNADVIAEVLSRANGVCECCKKPAPFMSKSKNAPFLEVHHIISLSADGYDTVENAEALCPNCHREKHFG